MGFQGSVLQCGEAGYLLWVLFSYWKNHRPKRALSVLCDASMKKGQCGQSKTTPLTLLMKTFSVIVFLGGVSALPPSSEIFTVVSCLELISSFLSCKGN